MRSVECIERICLALCLAAASGVASGQAHSPYVILDSKFPAEDFWRIAWVDNEQVLFTGVELGTHPCSMKDDPRCGGRGLRNAAYVWNVRENRVLKYKDRILVDLCVQQGYLSYKTRDTLEDYRARVFAGSFGKETKQDLPKRHWFNPVSCRYLVDPPVWAQRREEGRLVRPLLDEHGFIDYGLRDFSKRTPEEIRATYPVFWNHSGDKFTVLNIEPHYRENIPLRFAYVPFANEYMARAFTVDTSKLVPVFFLSPNGKIRKVEIPDGPWTSPGYFAIRSGLFLASGARKSFTEPGHAGGYVFAKGRVSKVVTGMLWQVSVSPDGCKVAFIYTWSQQAKSDGYRAWKQGKASNTIQMVDVCRQGGDK